MGYQAPEETLFKGFPVLKIFTGKVKDGEEEYFTIGVRKAEAICDQIDYIRKFADKHSRGGKS